MNPIDYEEIAREVQAIQRKLSEIRVTADSDDGLVTATVGGRGELVTLSLDPRIYRNPDVHTLATTISTTIHRAVEQAQGEVFPLVRRFLPANATPATSDLDFDPLLTALDRGTGRGAR